MTKAERQLLTCEATNDEMFVTDLKEVMNDFAYTDFEEIKSLDEMASFDA